MDIISIPGFTHPVSSLSHLLAAGVFAVLSIPLLRRCQGRVLCFWSLAIFAFTVVFLLSMSGVYHLLEAHGPAHRVLARLDHAAIFALIAGSFTPLQALFFKNPWARWGLLMLIWTIAILGIILKAIYFNDIPETLGLSIYLSLGWFGLVSSGVLAKNRGFRFILPMVWGGISYTVGALADFSRWPVLIAGVLGPHEIMHFGVLGGITGFWWFFYSRTVERW